MRVELGAIRRAELGVELRVVRDDRVEDRFPLSGERLTRSITRGTGHRTHIRERALEHGRWVVVRRQRLTGTGVTRVAPDRAGRAGLHTQLERRELRGLADDPRDDLVG